MLTGGRQGVRESIKATTDQIQTIFKRQGLHYLALVGLGLFLIAEVPPGSQALIGLVLAGGNGDDGSDLSSVETFPSLACSIPPLPQGKYPSLWPLHCILHTGRYGLSLTLLPGDGGRLVACGGRGSESSCVSWRRGQATWTEYSTLR